MTTNVIDHLAKQVCSDSRWSVFLDIEGVRHVIYVDDVGFHKVVHNQNSVLVMAGDAELIAYWKRWWVSGAANGEPQPPVQLDDNRMVVISIVYKPHNKVIFDIGNKLSFYCNETQQHLAVFAGSGGNAAAQFWGVVQCAIRSVEAAAETDPCTGGTVMFVDYNGMKDNLTSDSYNHRDILSNIVERGMIMSVNNTSITASLINNAVAIPLKEHAGADEIKKAIMSGKIHAGAPVSNMRKAKWTDERKEKLSEAIKLVFG